jgi:hypothetical protein
VINTDNIDDPAVDDPDSDPLVRLSVGGSDYTANLSTLTQVKDSVLGRMFASGGQDLVTDDDGRVFGEFFYIHVPESRFRVLFPLYRRNVLGLTDSFSMINCFDDEVDTFAVIFPSTCKFA